MEWIEEKKRYGIVSVMDGTRQGDKRWAQWKTRKYEGDFFTDQNIIANMYIGKSHEWIEKSCLRSETESLICITKEQALGTKCIRI